GGVAALGDELPEGPEGGWVWPRWATRAAIAACALALVAVAVVLWNGHQAAALVGEYVAREDTRLRLTLTDRGTFRWHSGEGSASGVYRLQGGRLVLNTIESSGRLGTAPGGARPPTV